MLFALRTLEKVQKTPNNKIWLGTESGSVMECTLYHCKISMECDTSVLVGVYC